MLILYFCKIIRVRSAKIYSSLKDLVLFHL